MQGESTTSNQGRGRGPANQGAAGRGQEGSGGKGPANQGGDGNRGPTNQGGGGDKGSNRPRPKVHRMANGKSNKYRCTIRLHKTPPANSGVIVQVP